VKQPIVLKKLDTFNCNGSTITLTPAGNDIDSIYWTTGAIAAASRTVAPTATTNYIYSAFNICGTFKDTATILSQVYPTLLVSNDTTICMGQTLKLKANSNIIPSWTNLSINDTIVTVNPSSTANYYVQASNFCGIVKDTVKVTVVNQPAVTAQNDTSICIGSSAMLTASSALPITWFPMNSSGSSTTVTPTSNSIYYAEVSNICGLKRDTVKVDVANPITLNLSNDTAICSGQPLKIQARSNAAFNWITLGLTDSIVQVNPTVTTSYPVVASSACGTLRDTIVVTVIPIPNVIARADTSICLGNAVKITAVSSQTITWTPGGLTGNSITVSPTSTSQYYADVSNSCGSKRDTVKISVFPYPSFTKTADTTICMGGSALLKLKANGSINWTNLGLSDSIVSVAPVVQTKYPFVVSNACGAISDTVKVFVVTAPSVVARTDTSICKGNAVILTANSILPITWYPMGTKGNSVGVVPPLSASYFAEVSNACGVKKDTVNITVLNKPSIQKSSDIMVCKGQPTTLTAISDGTITWLNQGSSGSSIAVAPIIPTIYKIQSTNICGTTRDSIQVSLFPSPIASAVYTVVANTMKLVNTSQNAGGFKWVFGDGTTSTSSNPIHTYSATGTYTCLLIASNSCGSDTFKYVISIGSVNSISNIEDSEWKIFPNPASDKLVLDISEYKDMRESKIEIYDGHGRCIQTGEVAAKSILEIDVSRLAAGVYFIRLSNNKVVGQKKFEVLR
jgi:PKD repeat protein